MSDAPRAVVVNPPLPLSPDFIDYPYFVTLAAYQVAAVLRAQGLEPTVVDGFTAPSADLVWSPSAWLGEPKESFLVRLGQLEAEVTVIIASPFLLGTAAQRWRRELVQALGQRAGLLVLADAYVGGMHFIETDGATLLAELSEIDLFLRYEAEPTLGRLAATLRAGKRPPREVWENRSLVSLTELPAPAYDLLDGPAYFAFLARVLGSAQRPGPIDPQPERTLPLVTARGCAYDCIFCTSNPGLPPEHREVRLISLDRIDAWLERWQENLGLERVVLLDELANLDPGRFDALLDLLCRRRLRVDFPNGLRADRLRREQLVALAELTPRVKVSLESASVRVQREILRKRLDPESVQRVARWCQEIDLPLDVHCMIGIPGETRREIRDTLEMAARLHEDHGARILLQYATPLPGTELERMSLERDLLVGPPVDLCTGFQRRSLLRTAQFDPAWLEKAKQIFERRLASHAHDGDRQRKVIINLTYRCNNRCVFCAVGDREVRDADLEAVHEALARYRRDGYELLDIDGGEPTLHRDLFPIIAKARALGYRRIAVITNGRRASYRKFARALARSGIDEVLVSLHAPEAELGEQLTGVADSHGQTVAGIENLLAELPSPERLGVNTTIVAENLAALPALGQVLVHLGVRRWNLQLVAPFGRARCEQLPSETQLTTTLISLLTQPPDGLAIRVINCPPCLLPGFESVARGDFDKASREMVFVGAAGENLQKFLSHRRRHTERCADCIEALLCPGEYLFADRQADRDGS